MLRSKGRVSCEYTNLKKIIEELSPIKTRFEIKECLKHNKKRAVYRSYDTDKKIECILKVIVKRNLSKRSISILHFLKNNHHDNIYKIYEIGEIGGLYIILSEYIDGMVLSKFMSIVKKPKILKNTIKGILHGLNFLHENNIQHVDIKPSNIVVQMTKKVMKPIIIDFDLAQVIKGPYSKDNFIMGTFPYIPKETFVSKKYYLKSDIWSLGVTIIKGLQCYCDDSDRCMLSTLTKSTMNLIKDFPEGEMDFYKEYSEYDFCTFEKKIGKKLCCIIKSMVNIDVNKRPNAKKLLTLIDNV